ncbi:plasmid partitioning protein RepB [Rhizobium daejeonense]|uniref:Plasmid partitioning protein RepB n=1 Tax=Rhizobium daejeonense TaxID=240521 RepID=A0A6M1RY94_9HYPH|nr:MULTISPECIES: plasmid partitioning protein RepB [Rhizobiaceae]NGO66582.1 plasmid partitioning protein RepB [Rhizobium daejeonense]QRI66785.1 plasmid partitioning protein RepB [Shinella sp. PSBB067]
MSKRRDALKDFLSPIQPSAEPSPRVKPAVQSGALNSMNQAIANLATEADQAESLRLQLEAGETIVELEPKIIHGSFVKDRLDAFTDPKFIELREGLKTSEQIIPVLVRPHPEMKGEYQLAFGHRRVEALRQLGRRVKAIVRNLSDEDLIRAQGKENTDRADLSFIEKALFALRLDQQGVRRQVIMDALTITSKGVLSGMISLASSLSTELIEAIGSAPSIGRPRWETLAQLLADPGHEANWRELISKEHFHALSSDARFESALKTVAVRKEKASEEQIIKTGEGRKIATAQSSKRAVKLTIPTKHTGDFAQFLLRKLPDIYEEFAASEANATSENK